MFGMLHIDCPSGQTARQAGQEFALPGPLRPRRPTRDARIGPDGRAIGEPTSSQTRPAARVSDAGRAWCVDPGNRRRCRPIRFREAMTPRAHRNCRRSGVQDRRRCGSDPRARARACHRAARSDRSACEGDPGSRAQGSHHEIRRRNRRCSRRVAAAPAVQARRHLGKPRPPDARARARRACDRW